MQRSWTETASTMDVSFCTSSKVSALHVGSAICSYVAADETSWINYIKPIILATELGIPHVLSIIDTQSQWYYTIHPERYVPALKDRDAVVFEGTACIQYLADRFDVDGLWQGQTAAEKAQVLSWMAYQTAGLG